MSNFCKNSLNLFSTYQDILPGSTFSCSNMLYLSLIHLFEDKQHDLLQEHLKFGDSDIYLLSQRMHHVVIIKTYSLVELFYVRKQSLQLSTYVKNNNFCMGPSQKCMLLSTDCSRLNPQSWKELQKRESTILNGFSSYACTLAQIYLKDEINLKPLLPYNFCVLDAYGGSLEIQQTLSLLLSPKAQGCLINDLLFWNSLLIKGATFKDIETIYGLVNKFVELSIIRLKTKPLTFTNFSITATARTVSINFETFKYVISKSRANHTYAIHMVSKSKTGAFAPSQAYTCSPLKYNSLILEISPTKVLFSGGYCDELFEVLTTAIMHQTNNV